MFDAARFRQEAQAFEARITAPNQGGDHSDDSDDALPVIDASLMIAAQRDGDLHAMTNFNTAEFQSLWEIVKRPVTAVHTGGRHSRFNPMTWFLIALTWAKHNNTFKQLSRDFGMSPQNLADGIKKTIRACADHLWTAHVKWTPLDTLILQQKTFGNFPAALCAVDATVQKVHRNPDTSQAFYSGKHRIPCIKVQAAVQPNGLLAEASLPVPGQVHDFELYRQSGLNDRLVAWTNMRRVQLPGADPMSALFDKGYIGISGIYPTAVIPHKKPPHQELTDAQKNYNRIISEDRILVERWFGRLKGNWKIMSDTWPLNSNGLNDYACYFRFCAALTNAHIVAHPLIDQDRTAYNHLAVPVYKRNQGLVQLGVHHEPRVRMALIGEEVQRGA